MALEAALEDAAATGDHERLAVVGSELTGVGAALAAVEDQWLALVEEADG